MRGLLRTTSKTLFILSAPFCFSGETWTMGAVPVSAGLLKPIQCPEITTRFLWNGETGCTAYPMLDRKADSYVSELRCRFKNDLNTYSYLKNSTLFTDIKGFSFGNIQGYEKTEDHSESFASCQQLLNRLTVLSSYSENVFVEPPRRPFHLKESVGLIASEHSCNVLQVELQEWVDLYRSENRVNSRVICVPQTIVSQENPSEINQYLQNKKFDLEGLVIVGTDIVPFETYSGTPSGLIWERAQTDLPYGANTSEGFWKNPLSKNNPDIAEKIYFSKNNIHKIDYPSSWTYNFAHFEADQYEQLQWVSRWVAPDIFSDDSLKNSIKNFLSRRTHYQPPQFQNFTWVEGSEGIMFEAGTVGMDPRQSYSLFDQSHSENQTRFLRQVDLSSTLKSVGRQPATIVELSEHGTPVSMGNLQTQDVSNLVLNMDLLYLSSCSTGFWSFLEAGEQSLLGALLGQSTSPLAVVAAQVNVYFPTATGGHPDLSFSEGLLDNWGSGMSLGLRQKKLIQSNFNYWKSSEFLSQHDILSALPSMEQQLFAGPSIFGDPTIEN